MRKFVEAQQLGDAVDPKHEVEQVCGACGYDLDEAEITADTCSDCGAELNLKQNTRIWVTTIPAAQGTTLE